MIKVCVEHGWTMYLLWPRFIMAICFNGEPLPHLCTFLVILSSRLEGIQPATLGMAGAKGNWGLDRYIYMYIHVHNIMYIYIYYITYVHNMTQRWTYTTQHKITLHCITLYITYFCRLQHITVRHIHTYIHICI